MGEGHHERLIAYLLGELPEQEQEAVEEAYVGDTEAFRGLLAAEEDLIDAYAADRLSTERRGRFEQHFLQASPERRERAAFARAFARLSPIPTVARRRRPAASWAALAAVVVLASLATGLLLARSRATERELEAVRAQRDAGAERARQSERRAAQMHEQIAALARELDLARATPRGLATAVLEAGLEREGTRPPVRLPSGAEWLHLRLLLDAHEYSRYQVDVEAVDGAVVMRVGPLAARRAEGGPFLDAMLPATALSDGTYIVALSGIRPDGRPEKMASYHLRVTPGR